MPGPSTGCIQIDTAHPLCYHMFSLVGESQMNSYPQFQSVASRRLSLTGVQGAFSVFPIHHHHR